MCSKFFHVGRDAAYFRCDGPNMPYLAEMTFDRQLDMLRPIVTISSSAFPLPARIMTYALSECVSNRNSPYL